MNIFGLSLCLILKLMNICSVGSKILFEKANCSSSNFFPLTPSPLNAVISARMSCIVDWRVNWILGAPLPHPQSPQRRTHFRYTSTYDSDSSIYCTGLCEKVPPKFGEESSVKAQRLCIGCLSQWAEVGRENSNMQEFFSTTLYYQ